MTAAWVLLAAVLLAAAWYAERRLHPFRRCPSCGGSGRNAGSSRDRWGVCRRCSGRGEVRRLGARRD